MVLTMNQRSILEDAGRISHVLAKQKANEEYRKYQLALREEEHLESLRELEQDLKELPFDAKKKSEEQRSDN